MRMATNNEEMTLDPKARVELADIVSRQSTLEQRERAATATVLLEAGLLAWIRRDETDEAGPESPNYFLEALTPFDLTLMLQIVSGVLIIMGEDQKDTDQFQLVKAGGVLIREELVGRVERLEADASGEAII